MINEELGADTRGELGAEELVKQTLLAKAEISVLLDSYDDIFSDFDPRPFSQRALSDDFLIEAKKATLDKGDSLDLSFMIPKGKRNFEHEVLIKRRLREHFRKHYMLLENEIRSIKRTGFIWIILGLLMLILATALVSYNQGNLFFNFLLVVLEPAGWFLFWIGGEKLVYDRREKEPELEFYRKMTKCEISFHPY